MALSIVRDLVRLYDPSLERTGALKERIEGLEVVRQSAYVRIDGMNCAE